MRELTLAELELISGGSSTTEVDGIVVVADGGGGGDWGDWGDWGDGGDWGDQGDSIDGGGGGDTAPDPDCGCPTSASPDQQDMRGSAADGADIILQQNWQNQEYGGFVYRDAATGEIKMGVITGSAVTGWTPTADNMQGISDYSQILGIIHSHGPNVPGQNHNFPSGGDWDAFDTIVDLGATNLTSLYILGADGQLREYDTTNRTTTNPGEVVGNC